MKQLTKEADVFLLWQQQITVLRTALLSEPPCLGDAG